MQYSRFAAWAVYWHGSAGQPPLPRLRVEAAAVPVSRLSGLVLHACDESAATTEQLVDSFMPLAAPLVSGDCAPPALEVHDGSLRQHSTLLGPLTLPRRSVPVCARGDTPAVPSKTQGCEKRDPDSWVTPCITRRCATLRSSSVWLHGCDEGPARHLSESNLCRRGQDRGDVDVLSFRLDVGHRVGHGYHGTPRCCS